MHPSRVDHLSGGCVIKHVVWDWNGTLLDDVDACVDSINSLLRERAMPTIARDHYLEHFGFPVRDFYVHLGFDLDREDFDSISAAFIGRYNDSHHLMRLHNGVVGS
jgi:phosphoglycolate phosphatase